MPPHAVSNHALTDPDRRRARAEACRARTLRLVADVATLLAGSRAGSARGASMSTLQARLPLLRHEVAEYADALRDGGTGAAEAERLVRSLATAQAPALTEDAEAIVELLVPEIRRAYAR